MVLDFGITPKTFVVTGTNAAGRSGGSLTGAQPSQAEASRDPTMVGLSIAADFTRGKSDRLSDMVDLNGDGLPDFVSDPSTAKLNVGYGFVGSSNGWADG